MYDWFHTVIVVCFVVRVRKFAHGQPQNSRKPTNILFTNLFRGKSLECSKHYMGPCQGFLRILASKMKYLIIIFVIIVLTTGKNTQAESHVTLYEDVGQKGNH
jgi:hypothetical protein